ncbi:hypothetical protein SAMN05428945_6063 [Streptomyces sp. 2224.1]|uniref:DUF6397 family protein n=1 Tax=unclassified Streptomyces TaxID=2593676 RepID=UPI0008991DA0|nr:MULTISPECIES: DUF6397 family protein [unclassified Streptomyces]SED67878.1 hypothetical protein SAMN05428954_0753 [Streptomyces sp. 2112.3]SED92448.1 hypothetical protein SAMN05428945_6063 [Streptomyces sp. 2224.1]
MTVMCDGQQTLTTGRAARELELRTGELELATQLGVVRTVAAGADGRPTGAGSLGRRRVPAEEIARLRAEPGFPDALRERIRAVSTTEAAALMGIGPGRAVRLTRAGCLGPVRLYVNRFGAVVWLYLAAEVADFADREPDLLRGNTPAAMRVMLDSGQDWRARQWRSRRIAQLMGQTDDPWEAAAVIAAVLPPEELASVAENPLERSLLRRLRPTLASVITVTPAARESFERVLTADEFDEVLWYRVHLSRCLERARKEDPGRPRTPAAVPSAAARPGQSPSFLNSPSWTTETSSLPSRS